MLADQLHRAGSVQDGLDRYERLWRPIAEEKQLTGRKAARWFLPHSAAELRMRRVTLALSRLPGMDRILAARIGGKHTALIDQLRGHQKPAAQR